MWVKLSDDFGDHEKVIGLSAFAIGVWTILASWCGRSLTDGHAPARVVRAKALMLGADAEAVTEELVTAGLWERTETGIVFHNWLDYNPSVEEQDEKRQSWRDKKRRQRGQDDCPTDVPPVSPGDKRGTGEGQSGDSPECPPAVPPSRARPEPEPEPEPVPEPGGFHSSSEIASSRTAGATPDTGPDERAARLCDRLADRIEANGSKRPNITRRWLEAARLLLDADGKTEAQVNAAIDWCQRDDFWRANVLSMPKLREKYDQLRLAAARASPAAKPSSGADELARMMREARERGEI
ncbi:MAG: hypothetical protein LBK42_01995 [Propionibacteriaceae bacterium]|jgi:hypothetical protein|nr:hypothetical protein [Propionibacteriaceae bacterium]